MRGAMNLVCGFAYLPATPLHQTKCDGGLVLQRFLRGDIGGIPWAQADVATEVICVADGDYGPHGPALPHTP
jgi:hypothetical protein